MRQARFGSATNTTYLGRYTARVPSFVMEGLIYRDGRS